MAVDGVAGNKEFQFISYSAEEGSFFQNLK